MTDRTNRRRTLIRASMLASLLGGAAGETAAFADVTPVMRAPPLTAPGATCPTWDNNLAFAGSDDPDAPVPTAEELEQQMLLIHNAERAKVNVEPMTWDPTLAKEALDYATSLVRDKGSMLIHASNLKDTGENLAGGKVGAKFDPVRLANLWLREGYWFRVDSPPSYQCAGNAVVGHYMQIIKRNNVRLGCGYAAIGESRLLACRYGSLGYFGDPRPYPAGAPSTWQNLYALQFADTDPASKCKAKVKKDDIAPAVVEALNCARRNAGVTTQLAFDPTLATQAQTSADARGALSDMWKYTAAAGATEAADNAYNSPEAAHPAALVYDRAVTNSPVSFKAATDVANTSVGCGWSAGPAMLNGTNWQRRIVVCRFK